MLMCSVINGMADINTLSIAGFDVISDWIKAWQLCDLLETGFQRFRILLSLSQPKRKIFANRVG
ncbi:hypothetical protein CF98_01740 [Halopseudomonas bauzanensis]|nr:hypothetical protein CF98_01740 [Halopseudomonas bauzanensis]